MMEHIIWMITFLNIPETATDAETHVINKVKTDQRKEHKNRPAPQKTTETIQPNPVDEHIREMARQADEESQPLMKRQMASRAFFESKNK
jgi:hypothetical protein